MKLKKILLLTIPAFFLSSCALMFPEELTFDESRVPGEYEGAITCSYEPCELSGPTSYTITEGESYFTLQFKDSLSADLQNLDFTIELYEESFGEAKTISGVIQLREGQSWKLTPYDLHFFYYWTHFETQQEGERFKIRIYQPESENTTQNLDYLELNGHKGIQ